LEAELLLLLHLFNSLFQDNLGTGKIKPVWISMRREMVGFWDAVASAGPYANNLHLTAYG